MAHHYIAYFDKFDVHTLTQLSPKLSEWHTQPLKVPCSCPYRITIQPQASQRPHIRFQYHQLINTAWKLTEAAARSTGTPFSLAFLSLSIVFWSLFKLAHIKSSHSYCSILHCVTILQSVHPFACHPSKDSLPDCKIVFDFEKQNLILLLNVCWGMVWQDR